jgi:hypothetical protein
VKEKRDLIIFDVFTPYTVEKMRRGRDELLALHEATPKDRMMVPIGGLQMSRVLLRKGAKYYQSAISRYLYNRVLAELGKQLSGGASWPAAVAALAPGSTLANTSEWTDMCGLIAPVEQVRAIERKITSGAFSSYDEVLAGMQELYDNYPAYEWQYCADTFEKETGVPLAELTREKGLQLVDDWQKAALSIQSATLEDSKKEFGTLSRIGYGLDLSEQESDADFRAVRGTLDGNAVIQKMAKEGEEIQRRAADLKALIGNAA